MNSTTTFLRLLWEHFASVTTDPEARLTLARTLAHRPVTGNFIHGWRA